MTLVQGLCNLRFHYAASHWRVLHYLLCKRFSPRLCGVRCATGGGVLAGILGQLDFNRFRLELAVPEWTTPSFSPGRHHQHRHPAVHRRHGCQSYPASPCCADGYQVPASPLISRTGIASILLAPFGSPRGSTWRRSARRSAPVPRPTRTRTSAIPRRSGAASSTASQEPSAPPWQRCSRRSQGTGTVHRRHRPARLDHERPGPNSMADEPQREAALVTFHGHRLRLHPAVHRLGVLGPGGPAC